MIKNSLLLLVFICSTIFADCLLYESEEYANEGVIAYRKQCEEYGGGGGKFSFSVSQSSSENTCAGGFVEGAYILRVSCNTCGSLEIVEELEKNKKFCNEKCKTPKMICLTQYEAWGSSLSGTVESCGMDDFSISGCEESSSSEEQRSSSMESSSSDTRSSSSANGSSDSGTTLSSTESGSSSGVVCEDGPCSVSSSSGAGATLEHCYQGAPGSCMFIGDYFFEIPRMLQPIVLSSNQTGRCREGKYAVQTNIPILIGYEYYCADDAGCSGPLHKKIAYSCVAAEGERTVEQGCMYDDGVPLYGRDGSSFAVVMLGKKGLIEVSSVWSASRHPTPAVFDTKELLDAVRQTYGDPEYLADSCAKLFSPQSSSQGCEEDPDSPYPCEESSSSSDIESSSSSETESSSSEEESSSSAGCFVSGIDQVYSPEQVFNDCLENMEPGKCYSLNPDRGVQTGWISSNAQDSWWWRVVDCGTGERVDSNKVGVCPGFPLERVPSNPESACFAYNGSCYKCNADRGSECSNSWLWQGTFASANIGWWYEEVDCDDPFEDDFDGQCPDKFYLEKSEADNHDYLEIKNYTIEYSVSQKDYDALGRRLNGKRPKFLRSFNKRENKNVPTSKNAFDVGNIIYIPVEKIGLSQNFLAKEGEECPDYPCGDIGKDYGVGNDVGVYCGHPCTKPIMENGFLRIEVTNKRQTGSCGKNNPKYTITFKLPATATIKRKNEYHVAPIGYRMGNRTVTIDEYEAAERHEIGHKESYSCLEDKNMFKSYYEFVLENVCEKNIVCDENDVLRDMVSSIKKKMDPKTKTGIDELLRYNNELWQRMCGWYHETFSHEDGPGGPGKPAELTCPSTNTLLKKKYDLTGCEVH